MTKTIKERPASGQLQISLDDLTREIKDREQRIDRKRLAAAQAVLDTFNEIIDQGKALLEMKSRLKHGQWEPWLAEHFPKSDRTARSYIAAYLKSKTANLLEDTRFQAELFKISGLAPEDDRPAVGAGATSVSIPPIIQKLNSVAEWVAKERDEIKSWPKERISELKQRLRPVVEFWNSLEP